MKHIYYRHIIGLLCTLGLTIGFVFGLLFFANSVENKITATKDLTRQLALYERNRAGYNEQATLLASLQERARVLDGLVIRSTNVPEMLSRIETLALSLGLDFEIQNVQTPLDAAKQKKLLVAFSAEGQQATLQSFFDILAAQTFLVHITSFVLEYQPGVEGLIVDNNTSGNWIGLATIEIQSFIE